MPRVFSEVAIDRVEKIYGRHRALAGVTLTLRAGRTTALLGSNGAGKSTLVGILATLVTPTKGTVRFGQLDPRKTARPSAPRSD